MSTNLRDGALRPSPSRPSGSSDESLFRLVVLDGFALSDGDGDVAVPETSQRLLVLMSLLDRPASRARVAGTLWPEASEQRAQGSLRTGLWRLGAARTAVSSRGELLALSAEVAVDLRESMTLARRVLRPGPRMECDATTVIERFSRDLLPGWYDDWVLLEAERWRQLRLHALEALSGRLTTERRFADALEAGMAAVRGEPLRESGHIAVMRAHLAEGNQCEAVAEFERYRDLLGAELGLEPTENITGLVRSLNHP
jgi:SARP family transcriptional regulator, regulator of embCAB operon